MADTLGTSIDDERAEGIRTLLGNPLLDSDQHPDTARLVFRHGTWLADWFEKTLGFKLVVDGPGGFARLFKRATQPDITRTVKRTRGESRPFDRRRYQLLCLICASLVRHRVTTIGLLADGLRSEADLDTAKRRERAAVVDVLRTLASWGVLGYRGGELDAFVDSAETNAILTADSHRLHQLLSSVALATQIEPTDTVGQATQILLAEPRYGEAANAATEIQRLRWTRHMAARVLFDDPVAHFDAVHPAVADYMANPSGRRWLRDRAIEAGFELEEREEGILAVDASAIATDILFPSPLGTVGQLALLLIDELVPADSAGQRRLETMSSQQLRRFVNKQLRDHPGWAKTYREGDGPMRLASAAVQLLTLFDLATTADHDGVVARPAMARYRIASVSAKAIDEHDDLPPPILNEQVSLL